MAKEKERRAETLLIFGMKQSPISGVTKSNGVQICASIVWGTLKCVMQVALEEQYHT